MGMAGFTDDELMVIGLRVNSIKQPQIAKLLGWPRRKVNDVMWDVYRKTGTDCVGALTRWAIYFGLDEMPELPSEKAQLQLDL